MLQCTHFTYSSHTATSCGHRTQSKKTKHHLNSPKRWIVFILFFFIMNTPYECVFIYVCVYEFPVHLDYLEGQTGWTGRHSWRREGPWKIVQQVQRLHMVRDKGHVLQTRHISLLHTKPARCMPPCWSLMFPTVSSYWALEWFYEEPGCTYVISVHTCTFSNLMLLV